MSASDSSYQANRSFARYVMSDIYALMDYLSGRAEPSLSPSTNANHVCARSGALSQPVESTLAKPSAPHHATPHVEAEQKAEEQRRQQDSIDSDLRSRSAFFRRLMEIGQALEHDKECDPADLSFLVQARDSLNRQATPATGNSISFTIRVMTRLLGRDEPGQRRHFNYIIDDAPLDRAAAALARFVTNSIRYFIAVLLTTVLVSTYVACGKLLLDTLDAVHRDAGANRAALVASAAGTNSSSTESGDWIDGYCGLAAPDASNNETGNGTGNRTGTGSRAANISRAQQCADHREIFKRDAAVHTLLRTWLWPFEREARNSGGDEAGQQIEDQKSAQWAATWVGLIGNYVLPILYGALGSFGFVLRRLNRQLADYLLTPRMLRANRIRILLGVMTGACIGLFVNTSAGSATTSGLGGAAVTLTASGIAFLAGYGVEAVFKMFDSLMNHVFRIDDQPTRGAAA